MKTLSFTIQLVIPTLLGAGLGMASAPTDTDPSRPPSTRSSSGTTAGSLAGTSPDREQMGDLKRLQEGGAEQSSVGPAAEIDPILGPQVSGILGELQRVYPLNPEEDLGDGLTTYLKGTRGWDDYLTGDVIIKIEAAKRRDREAITSLGAAFKFGNLPLYTYALTLKLLIEGAIRHSASALHTLSQVFEKGFGPIVKNPETAQALHDVSVTIRDPSVKELRQWLELPELPPRDE